LLKLTLLEKQDGLPKQHAGLKQAHALTSTDSDQWSINQRMIEIYVKDEQPDEALELISPMIDANPNSIDLLKKGTELAILQKEISTARRWNQRYLKNQPNSIDALTARSDIETIDENYEDATEYVKRAIKLAPKDYKLRERWAYLEETQGNDKLAMQLWKWMHEKTNEPNYQQQIIRMAQADLKGEGLALLMLISHMQQHGPEKDLMEILGKWYGGEKRYEDALATWEKIAQIFGSEMEQDLMRFELYWAMKEKDKAFQLWRDNYNDWDATAKPNQLEIMAEVTWSFDQNQASLTYYQKLLKLTNINKIKERTLYHTRLALLHSKLNQPALAYKAFKRGFMETADADLMISGMQTAFDAKDYKQFEELLKMSREQASSFNKMPRYWLMQASLAMQQQQYSDATNLYNKVLALEPRSKDALAGIKSLNAVLADAKKQATLNAKTEARFNCCAPRHYS